MILSGEVEAVSSENLVVPRTPSWLISVRWLASDGSLVKMGDRVVEFDASSLTTTLEDKRGAIVRAEGELASQVAKDRGTPGRQGDGGGTQAGRGGEGHGRGGVPPDLISPGVSRRAVVHQSRGRRPSAMCEDSPANPGWWLQGFPDRDAGHGRGLWR